MAIIFFRGHIKLTTDARYYYTIYKDLDEHYYVEGWYRNIPKEKAMVRFNPSNRYTNPVSAVLHGCEEAATKLMSRYYDTGK